MPSLQMLRPPVGRGSVPAPRRSQQHRGFTLIEVLVTLAIVAILAGISYASYRSQVERTRRANAEAVLMQAGQRMERLYTEFGCYNPDPDAGCPGADTTPSLCPLNESPIDAARDANCESAQAYYRISLKSLTATTFTLQAVPVAGNAEAGAGNLELDNTGLRRRDFNKDGTVATTEAGW
jgi:type IV pilus assembly protein PilE